MNALFARSSHQEQPHATFLGQAAAPLPAMFRQTKPAPKVVKEQDSQNSFSARKPPARLAPQRPAPSQNTALSPLGERERALINAIAAHQFRYGQMDEALALLQLSLRYAPEDIATLRLLAQVLAAAGDWDTVDQILDAVDRLGAPKDRRGAFLRMLSALRRKGVAAAQNLYHNYLSFGA